MKMLFSSSPTKTKQKYDKYRFRKPIVRAIKNQTPAREATVPETESNNEMKIVYENMAFNEKIFQH